MLHGWSCKVGNPRGRQGPSTGPGSSHGLTSVATCATLLLRSVVAVLVMQLRRKLTANLSSGVSRFLQVRDNDGDTPLMVAAHEGNMEARVLLRRGGWPCPNKQLVALGTSTSST